MSKRSKKGAAAAAAAAAAKDEEEMVEATDVDEQGEESNRPSKKSKSSPLSSYTLKGVDVEKAEGDETERDEDENKTSHGNSHSSKSSKSPRARKSPSPSHKSDSADKPSRTASPRGEQDSVTLAVPITSASAKAILPYSSPKNGLSSKSRHASRSPSPSLPPPPPTLPPAVPGQTLATTLPKPDSSAALLPSVASAESVLVPKKTAASLSSFAKRLLVPRAPQEVEVPEAIPLNDFILEGFGQEHVHRPTAQLEEDESSEEEEGGEEGGVASVGKPGAVGCVGDDKDEDGEERKEDAPVHTCKTLRAWNLWFSSTEDTLRRAFGRFGELERFEMLYDRDTKKFRGVVIATYKKASDAGRALTEMEGTRIDNRNVFLEASERKKRGSMGKGESRYFLLDKTLFCRRCHEVGHTMKFCPNPAKAKPCTICAAIDGGHDADSCPEVVRAGPVGVLCLQCGASGHEDSVCVRRLRATAELKAHTSVRCLRCAQMGHGALCGPHAAAAAAAADGGRGGGRKSPRYVYCFRCGSSGHFGYHCDSRPQGGTDTPMLRRHSYSGTHIRYNATDPPPPFPPSGPPAYEAPSHIPQHPLVPAPIAPTYYLQQGRGGKTVGGRSSGVDDGGGGGGSRHDRNPALPPQYHAAHASSGTYSPPRQDYKRRRSGGNERI